MKIYGVKSALSTCVTTRMSEDGAGGVPVDAPIPRVGEIWHDRQYSTDAVPQVAISHLMPCDI
jgi:hypothetical protein